MDRRDQRKRPSHTNMPVNNSISVKHHHTSYPPNMSMTNVMNQQMPVTHPSQSMTYQGVSQQYPSQSMNHGMTVPSMTHAMNHGMNPHVMKPQPINPQGIKTQPMSSQNMNQLLPQQRPPQSSQQIPHHPSLTQQSAGNNQRMPPQRLTQTGMTLPQNLSSLSKQTIPQTITQQSKPGQTNMPYSSIPKTSTILVWYIRVS